MNKFNLLLLIIITSCTSCTKNISESCDDSGSLYLLSKYPLGVAIDMNALQTIPAYRSITVKQFNSITAENAFKAVYIHPSEGSFNWVETDSLLNFCDDHQKRLHGHTLIWHRQLPQWILEFDGGANEWDNLMKEHIQTIVSRYKGRVTAWDVVNEAFNEDGTLRNSIWRKKIGDAYISKAFQYAHEADPQALLFYNDYNLESNPEKRNAVIAYFNSLRNNGTNVDGIGLQMHISIDHPELSQIAEVMQHVVLNDYKLHLSELDISVNPDNQDIGSNLQGLLNKQSAILSKIIRFYNDIEPKHQYGITFWGVSDKHSWIRSYYGRMDYPLLYDDNYLPKPSYCMLRESL